MRDAIVRIRAGAGPHAALARVLAVVLLLLGAVSLTAGCGSGGAGAGAPSGGGLKLNSPAPDFATLTTAGKEVSLSALSGKPVWLIFGATWCTDCRTEAKDIEAVHQAYGDKVEIIAVYSGEKVKTVDDYAGRMGLTFTQVADQDDEVTGLYRVNAFPTHVFVDAKGVVSGILMGPVSERAATEKLDPLVK
jgi:peroxiredoxin